jgi:hypothetical protein
VPQESAGKDRRDHRGSDQHRHFEPGDDRDRHQQDHVIGVETAGAGQLGGPRALQRFDSDHHQ